MLGNGLIVLSIIAGLLLVSGLRHGDWLVFGVVATVSVAVAVLGRLLIRLEIGMWPRLFGPKAQESARRATELFPSRPPKRPPRT
jgi:hypothetical protein